MKLTLNELKKIIKETIYGFDDGRPPIAINKDAVSKGSTLDKDFTGTTPYITDEGPFTMAAKMSADNFLR